MPYNMSTEMATECIYFSFIYATEIKNKYRAVLISFSNYACTKKILTMPRLFLARRVWEMCCHLLSGQQGAQWSQVTH